MTAVLPRRLSINRKSLTASGAGDLPYRPAVNLIEVGVPPFVPALVRAELLFLPAGVLCHRRSAAKTPMLACASDLRLILLLCVPAAEGFHCIFRDSDFPGDCSIAHALRPERGHDHSLFVRHRCPSNL